MKTGILWIGVPLLLAQNGVVVEGTAFNKVTNAGVAGVTVTLAEASAPDKKLFVARSDAAGAFHIDGLREGDYVASFEAPNGFLAPERWDPWCQPFHVAAAGLPTKLAVPVTPLGILRGRVLDGDGRPVPRVRVEIFRVHYQGGSILTTDAEGRFVADQLTSGAYQLRARPVLAGTPLGQKPEDVSPLPAKPPEGDRWIWAPTYFPNAIEIGAAQTIVVRDGAELAGYEIRLRAAPVYRLRGLVLDDDGKPAGGVDLFLLSEIGWGRAEARTKSGEDGGFEFPSVRAGSWQISAELARGKVKWTGFTELSMPRHDIEDVKVRITAPFLLEGSIEWTPTRPAKTRMGVALVATTGGEHTTATQEEDGSLRFEDVYAGSYRIGAWNTLPGYYLKSILLGARDVTGQDVYLARDSPSVKVLYQSNAARVTGKVENGAGMKVVLIEADREHLVPGQSLRAAVCDREGQFAIEGLRPTTYYVFAFAIGNVEDGAVTEAVFTRGLWREARAVSLGEGETSTIELKVTRWPE